MEVRRLLGGRPVIRSSPMKTSPAVGVSNPAIIRRTVVFPHPDGPRRVTRLPSLTSRDTPSTATTGPLPPRPSNSFLSPLTRTALLIVHHWHSGAPHKLPDRLGYRDAS